VETFFVLVLLWLLAAGAWGALAVARRFEISASGDDTPDEDE
jgi:hypothetical protein